VRELIDIFCVKKGDLGIVPRSTAHIPTNLEKMNIIQPKKELAALKKVIRKTVGTQTLDFTKASVFGPDIELLNREKTHPIYETIEKRAGTPLMITTGRLKLPIKSSKTTGPRFSFHF